MSAWVRAQEPGLLQGSYLPNCLVPVFEPDFDPYSLIHNETRHTVTEDRMSPRSWALHRLGRWIDRLNKHRNSRATEDSAIAAQPIQVDEFDLIIMTQSCDLENGKVRKVALCAITSIDEFEKDNPGFKKQKWNDVKRGRIYGLYALPPLPDSILNHDGLIVDFREIISLSYTQLISHAAKLETRWRLQSPHLEHFSRAFGDYFSRVALP